MRRLLILNLILFAVVVSAAVRLHNDWVMFEASHQPGTIQPEPEVLPKVAATTAVRAPAPLDWTDIPSHNPFSFDRTDIAILEPSAPPKPPGPKPILFGTMSLGNNRMAMVAQGKPGNRNYRPMKIGEVVDGWTITQILDTSIIIRADSIEDSVLMNDAVAQVPREYTHTAAAPAAPPVISLGQPTPAAAASTPSLFQSPTSQPATGQPRQRRRITQQTPFGTREIEIEE